MELLIVYGIFKTRSAILWKNINKLLAKAKKYGKFSRYLRKWHTFISLILISAFPSIPSTDLKLR